MGQDRRAEKRKKKKVFGETPQEKEAIKLRKFFLDKGWYLLLCILFTFAITGCAALQEMITDIPTTDAGAEIAAVEVIAGDFLKEPYQTTAILGIGYALALLRRWYKKKQGAKNV